MINGPEGFTPDNEFILGESEVRGFFVAAGFCAHGIAGAGGIGRQVASWIVDGEPELDLWKMDIRRFGGAALALARVDARPDDRGLLDLLRHPLPQRGAPGRPAAADVADVRAARGPRARSSARSPAGSGPNWFEPNADDPRWGGRAALEARRPRGWAGQHWSPAIAAEALATRQAVAIFDETSFAKIEVIGSGAAAFLGRLCANEVDVPVGRVVYTPMLNSRGGIETDLTVTRVAPDRYLLVTGTAFGHHDLGWLREAPAGRRHASLLNDITSGRVCFGLWGPARPRPARAAHDRRPLERGVPVHDRAGDDGRPRAGATRCGSRTSASSAGSCTPTPSTAGALWDTLWEAGREHGLVAAGYRAIDALRLEKGYRVWSSDITPDENAVRGRPGVRRRRSTRSTAFIGRDALVAAKAAGPEAAALPRPRRPAGRSASATSRSASTARSSAGSRPAATGYAVERSIAYAYLPPDCGVGTRGEVALFGEWIGFEVAREPLYDPAGERLRS